MESSWNHSSSKLLSYKHDKLTFKVANNSPRSQFYNKSENVPVIPTNWNFDRNNAVDLAFQPLVGLSLPNNISPGLVQVL